MAGFYDLTLAPGATDRIPAQGREVRVFSAPNGALKVKLDSGEAYSLAEGTGIRFARDKAQFRDVFVTNPQALAQTVVIFVGDAADDKEFLDSRITGTVTVVDRGRAAVLQNGSFWRGAARTLAAGVPVVQVFNPAASGKRTVVRGFEATPTIAATSIIWGWNTTQYTNVALGNSLLGGGVQSASQIHTGDAATTLAAIPSSQQNGIVDSAIVANQTITRTFIDPIILPPGYGMVLTGSGFVAGDSLTGRFLWNEEPL